MEKPFTSSLHTSPDCFLTGSAALAVFGQAECVSQDSTHDSRERGRNFAMLLQRAFPKTLYPLTIKDIDYCVSPTYFEALENKGGVERIGRALLNRNPEREMIEEFFLNRSAESAVWRATIGDKTIWLSPIEDIICHMLVIHIYCPPADPVRWSEMAAHQALELLAWCGSDVFLRHLANVAREHTKELAALKLFEERSDENVVGEVLYLLHRLRGVENFGAFFEKDAA